MESRKASTPGDDLGVSAMICLFRHAKRANATLNKNGAPEILALDCVSAHTVVRLTLEQEDVPDSRAVFGRNNADKPREYPNTKFSMCPAKNNSCSLPGPTEINGTNSKFALIGPLGRRSW